MGGSTVLQRSAMVIALVLTLGGCRGESTPSSAPAATPGQPAGTGPGGAYTPSGPLVADSGFRPTSNGLPFANYGEQLPGGETPTNMTVDDLRRMFGDGVCVQGGGATCDLIPPAQDWLDSTNREMAGGHCYGFAVAANMFWQQKVAPATFGAPQTPDLSISKNDELQRGIASAWAMQLLESVRNKTLGGAPNALLQHLRGALKPNPSETFTVVFAKRDGTGGHAVTPYAVEDKGGGKFNVLIYDNNYSDISRAIEFDTNANSWRYEASINPEAAPALYEGDATSKTLWLLPTEPGLGPQPCPFCDTRAAPRSGTAGAAPAGATAATAHAEIYLDGGTTQHSHLLITDGSGRRLGYVDGKLVNEIPGASANRLIATRSWELNREPRYVVPARGKYTIVADGSSLRRPERETFGIIGPSYAVSIKNVTMRPGDKDTLVADKDGGTVSYATTRSKRFTVRIGVSDQGAHYAVELGAVSQPDHRLARLQLPPGTGSFSVDRTGAKGGSAVDLRLTRSTPAGIQRFRHDGIRLAGADAAELQYGKWTDERQGMPVVTTENGHQATVILSNQVTQR
jgi:hypothetical protein